MGQVGGQQAAAAAVPSLMQMAQGEAPAMGSRGGGPPGGQFENPWDNPANWGPPPEPTGPMSASQQGWFPSMFQQGSDPQGKFWSMGDYMRRYQQKFGGQLPEVMDETHNNTINPAMLANAARPLEPGAFMYGGHHISPGQLREDLYRGQNPPAGAEGGGNWSPIRRVPGMQLGSMSPAVFHHGSTARVGLPGQLEPWAIGLEGPG
jgi:hypothetical protein